MNDNKTKEHPGVVALRRMLRDMRSDDQDGYMGFRNGKWDNPNGHPVGCATPDELDAMFDLVGVVPDEIVSKGTCDTCRESDQGRERGYFGKCSPCMRPSHSNWAPLYNRETIDEIELGRRIANKRHAVCPSSDRGGWMTMTAPGVFWCYMCGATVTVKALLDIKPMVAAQKHKDALDEKDHSVISRKARERLAAKKAASGSP